MQARLATVIGERVKLRIYWGDACGGHGTHNAHKTIRDTDTVVDIYDCTDNPDGHAKELWPTQCDHCGLAVPEELFSQREGRQVNRGARYDTPSGELEPGCLYWRHSISNSHYWDNHNGPMLHAVLPNGAEWNIDSRASNCALPDNRTHRCWCRHGEPPDITVNKTGETCGAGGGSIDVSGWHGHLENGVFREC